MGAMQPWHLLIVALVFVLLFGAKKLPEMARSIGQSARVFKSEMKGMHADDEARAQSTGQAPAQQQALPAAQAPTQAESQAQATEGSSSSDNAR
ncbi:MAG TPA: Sec-independent protein translocase subunit TatA [Pseudonocardia sp.]|jgi:sec-independent protein translocase protein TatA